MDWKKLIANLSALTATNGGTLAFVPEKYQPYVLIGLNVLHSLAALYQQPPTTTTK